MAIFAQSVYSNNPLSVTSASGTSAQVVTGAILTLGGSWLNGKPFWLEIQGYVKAHGTSQTIAIGFQGAKYSTGAFSGTQLGTGTASGAMTAGNFYPFSLTAWLTVDNASGILTGSYSVQDGVSPTLKAPTVLANLISGISVPADVLSNPGNPIASAIKSPVLQFCPTFTNSVSDTSEIVTITSFYAATD